MYSETILLRMLCCVLASACMVLVGINLHTHEGGWLTPPQESIVRCISPNRVAAPVLRAEILAELSTEEVRTVAAFFSSRTGAMDGWHENATMYMSGPAACELYMPTKADALKYLDGKTDKKPARYARVTAVREGAEDVMEYKVGPIGGTRAKPTLHGATIEATTRPGAIPLAKRPYDNTENSAGPIIQVAIAQLHAPLSACFGELWPSGQWRQRWQLPGSAGHVYSFLRADVTSTVASRISKVMMLWFREYNEFEATWLHPIPFSFMVNQTGANSEAWFAFNFELCAQGPYATASALNQAWHAGTLRSCSMHPDPSSGWDLPNPPAAALSTPLLAHRGAESSSAPPPVTIDPHGARYQMDPGSGSIQWMGWALLATPRMGQGLALFDVRFGGRRIAYELSLQDAAAVYGGKARDSFFYADASFSMSQLSGRIKSSLDCPTQASYMNSTLYTVVNDEGGYSGNLLTAASFATTCVFEADVSTTLWRHTDSVTRHTSGARDTQLVVRNLATVGNYDYISEVRLHLDGTIEVNTFYCGFMETRWHHPDFNPDERQYSEPVHMPTNLSAPLHSHLANWKVDLDVYGRQNSLEKIQSVIGQDAEGFITKMLERSVVSHEAVGVSTTVPEPLHPAIWRVTNRAEPNPNGGHRGYAIVPKATSTQMLPPSHPYCKAQAYTKYTLAFTQFHDKEYRVSSVYDMYAPAAPIFSLDDFIDGESMDQEDIVAWVTTGREHIPRTEDIPLVSNFGSGFLVQPWNYFERNAAMQAATQNIPLDGASQTCLLDVAVP